MDVMQQVAVLGATGSIGKNTLDVIARHPERYQVFALSGHQNLALLLEQVTQFQPQVVIITSEKHFTREWQARFEQAAPQCDIQLGEQALVEVAKAPSVDIVMAAIVGAAGLKSTLAAAAAGKKLLLANKESLVIAGELMMNAVADSGATLLPIDSEHNAIFQCLPSDYAQQGFNASGIQRVLLTGSGGPFREWPLSELAAVTPQQACAHPNWEMGQKISVDSATMMNKGLEVIEACHLFALSSEQLEVVIHPQSIIHSMVSYVDGSVIAQMGQPDMRTPIAYGLSWPERIDAGVEALDFSQIAQLTFEQPDYQRYPCLQLAFAAFRAQGSAATVLNAANEVAVAAFLAAGIKFTDIAKVNEAALNSLENQFGLDIDGLIQQDHRAREFARDFIKHL
ncbi:MAG: 1-deoxy-D-xylulose-5-phosphate reductoisomerase [Gammaproteobacteria bacterium]|nr:1-deoxy-D-xylulose-5-phosphate reductoisomerase [Gammaproteobacteria bacterium]